MKLYNKTRVPGAIIEPLLVEAGRVAHARTSGVVVIVNPGRSVYRHSSGVAHRALQVAKWFLSSHQYTKESKGTKRYELKKGWVDTDGGYFTITLPTNSRYDPLTVAENFFAVAAHEWTHIRQYQRGDRFYSDQRRRRHDNRPWEKEANKVMKAAYHHEKLSSQKQETILNLAIELEQVRKEKSHA